VRPDTIDIVWSAFRRSFWLVLLLIGIGIVAMNLDRQRQGPSYTASAEVLLSPMDLASALAGSVYVDPDRLDETESALAQSPGLYRRVAQRTGGTLGTGSEIRSATKVSQDQTTIAFSSTSSERARAIQMANAVAAEYPEWRTDVTAAAIDRAIEQLQTQASTDPDPALQEQLDRLTLLKTLTSGNVLLVEPTRSATKTRPNPMRDSIVGALAGLLIGLVAVGLRESIDTRVRSETEVEEILDVPVIGTVERLPSKTRLVMLGAQSGRYDDVYGLLAASVAQTAGSGPTVIAVTSATAQEGKTTTAANLAAALAKRNANVILADFDTRNPSIAKLFRVPEDARAVGLYRVSLNGHEDVAQRTTTTTPPKNGGEAAKKPTGSLRVLPERKDWHDGLAMHREELAKLAAQLRERADYVILDTPPALSTPDASELAKLVDMVLIVVREGYVSRRGLNDLGRLLKRWPSVSLNAVLVGTASRDAYAYYAPR
jgi:Mrp family chromosome partitioning ATPase